MIEKIQIYDNLIPLSIQDSIKTLKILIENFNVPKEIEKLKREIESTLKTLSPEGDIHKNYKDFLENITNLNKNEAVSDQQKDIADSGSKMLEETKETFDTLIANKIYDRIQDKKEEMAKTMFNAEPETSSEPEPEIANEQE